MTHFFFSEPFSFTLVFYFYLNAFVAILFYALTAPLENTVVAFRNVFEDAGLQEYSTDNGQQTERFLKYLHQILLCD